MPVADGDGEAAKVGPDDPDPGVLGAGNVQLLALALVGRLVARPVRSHACKRATRQGLDGSGYICAYIGQQTIGEGWAWGWVRRGGGGRKGQQKAW